MPLTQFQRNTLNTQIISLLNALPKASQDQSTKEGLLIAYQTNILSTLQKILERKKHDKDLKIFLSDNWSLIKSTALSYTALPHSEVTKLLCDIANALSDKENPAITLLMPGISTKNLSDTEKDLDKMDLEYVIKTHILGDNATYLIPINLISIMANGDNNTKINNPYFNDSIHQEKESTLSVTELARLVHHSDHTQRVANLKKSYDDIANDQSNLLNKLKKLISLMTYISLMACNSVYNHESRAVGTAVKEGFVAIAEFFDYFNQLSKNNKENLPESLKNELDILIKLAESGGQEKDANGNLVMKLITRKFIKRDREGNSIVTEETVPAILENSSISSYLDKRTRNLMDAIDGHGELLASISRSEEQKFDLLAAIQQKLTLAFQDFENAQKSHYVGSDSLNITAKLLNTFNIDFNPKNIEEISGMFKFLNTDELLELLTLDNAAEKVILAIGTVENLVILMHELSSEKLALLLSQAKDALKENILIESSDIVSCLITFDQPNDIKKFNIISSALIELETLVTEDDSFIIMHHLNSDQRMAIYNANQERLPALIKTSLDFASIMHGLTADQRIVVYRICQEQLSTLINRVSEVVEIALIMVNLTPDQCTAVWNASQERFSNLIKTADDLALMVYHLTIDQRMAIYNSYNAFQDRLPRLIKTADDFALIMRCFTPDQHVAIYNANRERLPTLIKRADDFASIMLCLTPEQCTAVCNDSQDRLSTLIKTASDFASILYGLTPDQCTAVCNACQERLSTLIHTVRDFHSIISKLRPDQRTAAYNACQKRLSTLIKTTGDFESLIPFLTADQQIDLCNIIREKLPRLIEEKSKTTKKLNHFDILFLQWLMLVSDLQNYASINENDPTKKNITSPILQTLAHINLNFYKEKSLVNISGPCLFSPVKNQDSQHFSDRAQKLISDYNKCVIPENLLTH